MTSRTPTALVAAHAWTRGMRALAAQGALTVAPPADLKGIAGAATETKTPAAGNQGG